MNIPFNKPCITGKEKKYIEVVFQNQKFSGDGPFNKKCCQWIEDRYQCKKAFLTPSGTHALEMASLILQLKPGDEVVLPSYTFTSTANAFALWGVRLVFVDIRPDTMNINEQCIESAITDKTKAIVVVHYAGVSCHMDEIIRIGDKYNIPIIEDAAQGVGSSYNGNYVGTVGSIGCFSFHETKNYSCGEGGAILLNNPILIEKAEIIREKGTNREKFFRGEVDKYTWIDLGSSYLLNEMSAAYLFGQFMEEKTILTDRMNSWNLYYSQLMLLQEKGFLTLPSVPKECRHNAHMFYVKTKDENTRNSLMDYLKKQGIHSVFHYIPLHSSPAGKKYGRFHGQDHFTSKESSRLLRLPMFYGLTKTEILYICSHIKMFFNPS
ncbi:MAG: dTDP-4-amino-4,6-dideoxygalactose transaminase [Caldisericia bacterium]|nr:dTDP-4-amino-4,6-dideoxygalactose transaminase [Caldisericia bacterium]MDD4614108.1 dTDP-4-amino-4,6-dideoxygalactose transaminase [Caldisericia bacterium]